MYIHIYIYIYNRAIFQSLKCSLALTEYYRLHLSRRWEVGNALQWLQLPEGGRRRKVGNAFNGCCSQATIPAKTTTMDSAKHKRSFEKLSNCMLCAWVCLCVRLSVCVCVFALRLSLTVILVILCRLRCHWQPFTLLGHQCRAFVPFTLAMKPIKRLNCSARCCDWNLDWSICSCSSLFIFFFFFWMMLLINTCNIRTNPRERVKLLWMKKPIGSINGRKYEQTVHVGVCLCFQHTHTHTHTHTEAITHTPAWGIPPLNL